MAGVLNISTAPLSRPFLRRKSPSSSSPTVSVKASSEPSTSAKEEEKKPEIRSTSTATFAPPPNFTPPEPKRFGVRSDKILDVFGAALALFFRLGTGVFSSGWSASIVSKNEFPPGQYALEVGGYKVKETSKLGPRPEKPIEIYEFESCPFCRKVREMAAYLDLDVLFYPCPRNGPNFRPKAVELGGKQQFPYMVDPNTGVSMYESDNIIKYLAEKYGDGSVPIMLSLGLLTTLTEGFAMIGRMGRGSIYTPSKMPPQPLEIWAYEGSPFCKLVREVLVELELPHIQHCVARGSPRRQILYERVGHFQAPYLEDPNTGVNMFESAEIVEYLKATYAL